MLGILGNCTWCSAKLAQLSNFINEQYDFSHHFARENGSPICSVVRQRQNSSTSSCFGCWASRRTLTERQNRMSLWLNVKYLQLYSKVLYWISFSRFHGPDAQSKTFSVKLAFHDVLSRGCLTLESNMHFRYVYEDEPTISKTSTSRNKLCMFEVHFAKTLPWEFHQYINRY